MVVPCEVPSRLPCRIAFLGEAPGDEETEKGRPLVGPSGRIFDALLRTANLDRRDFWIGNVFDEQAPENDVQPWLADEARLRPALDRLASELEMANPTVIVPMGGTPLFALTGSASIMKFRGAVTKATRVRPGVKIVPTLHPAFVMRQWKWFAVVAGDFIKAAREADRGPAVVYPKREVWLEPTLEDIRRFKAEYIDNSELLGVDIETGWGQITCIGFAPSQERAICVPFVDLRKPTKSYWGSVEKEVEALLLVKAIMESPVPKVGQNFGAYDAFWLLDTWGIRSMGMQHDTRLLHHALYPELPKDLAFLGANYTSQGPWKTWSARRSEKRDD